MTRPPLTPGSTWWTGYPFVELGDPPYQRAPIRELELLAYDGDKYARVRLPDGQEAEVKAGYLFPTLEEAYAYEVGA